MGLSFVSINSGSNGNCYYVGNAADAVLVDAGISCREIERRMARLQLPISRLRAIFISHEHSDHIRGLSVFSQKHQLPVYITAPTLLNGRLALQQNLVRCWNHNQLVNIGSLEVIPFSKHHDAADPYSFVIRSNGVQVGVFTDIGRPCRQLIHWFQQCHAAFLESNYDDDMLDKGGYPYHLKMRIRGGNGHLSNRQALELFTQYRPQCMSHLVLAHLSQNNNCPTVVEKLFAGSAGTVHVSVASRFQEGQLFHIEPVERPRAAPAQLSFQFL